MANVFKLRKGLDINLSGKAETKLSTFKTDGDFALVPDDYVGLTPKVAVREGDKVVAGDVLFTEKNTPEVKVCSPVSGTVTEVVRGERRKLLYVRIKADATTEYKDFGRKDASKLSAQQVIDALLESGLLALVRQLPYAVVASPTALPKSIFVSAFRDMPLAADFDYELEGNESDFQTGLTALSRIATTHLGISKQQADGSLAQAKDVTVSVYDGKCPAANVSVHVNHVDPVNKSEVVWTVNPTAVIFMGRLFNSGRLDLRKRVAVAGSEISAPAYIEVVAGQNIKPMVEGQVKTDANVRIIKGNPLTGTPVALGNSFIGALTSEVTVIPEGDDRDELLGWAMPRLKEFSANRSYFSWLFGKKKEYTLDARIKGGERHIIMSGEYDRVLPMDIYSEYLIKAIITGDIDKMEQLGIYEVAPEDFAVAEFVDSSKLELQRIVREGLDMLRKENA